MLQVSGVNEFYGDFSPTMIHSTKMLPGGANPVPGRDFHPQSTSAFSRRTCDRDISAISLETDNAQPGTKVSSV